MEDGSRPQIQPPHGVIFDFDGTLSDSYQGITASVNHVRGLRGLPPLDVATVRRYVGRGTAHLLQQTVPNGDVAVDLERYRAHHPSVLRIGSHLMPGAAEVVAALKQSGRRIGVCSNKAVTFTRDLLDYLKLQPWVDVVVGPEDVAHPKPAPDMLLLALERLQLQASEALYIGDMSVDIQAAHAAGVSVWAVPTGSEDRATLLQEQPDRVLQDLREILYILPPG